ncbi:MAG: Gfo/Idh/MocA family oxidoreductase [Planctomycetota bacterium]|nr:Gfo/Idh/MocA family oxidoreductase [Planctomycetota bacterium]
MHDQSSKPIQPGSRRDFLKSSSLLMAGGAVASTLGIARSAHAAGDDQIKIALIGCGGRGSGAASQALHTEGNVKLIALGDAFEGNLNGCLNNLNKDDGIRDKIDVPKERQFVGFDAYQKVLDAGPDLVILATPPGFRPIHFDAAVKAGKHVFMEKPVASDAGGVRMVLAAAEEAKKKNLGVGVGLQRRHQEGYIETIKQLQDGAIGDIIAARVYWNGATPWVHSRESLAKNFGRPLTEMEYQMKNWYYFTWICGDHIVEQHIHNLDVINWLKNAYPVKANGMGGCQVRKGKDYGETFDHHAVEFTYADGTKMFSQCRHIPGCWNAVSEYVHGSKGHADIGAYLINGQDGKWTHKRKGDPNPYQVEHDDLFASIRAGSPINEAEAGAKSTMTAILGRMCTYSGKELTWDEAINSKKSLMPTQFTWDAEMPVNPGEDGMYKLAVPGLSEVV